jgi:FixJ family two-component response regulator
MYAARVIEETVMNTAFDKGWACGLDDVPVVSILDAEESARREMEELISALGLKTRLFARAADFLAGPRVFAPGCLIVNATLPDCDGLDVQNRVRDRFELPLIFTAAQTDVGTTVRAMKAGALEFMIKPIQHHLMACAIQTAIEKSRAALIRESKLQALRTRYGLLSPRERQVMALVTNGLMNKVIGAELGIREFTVKIHRRYAMQKMRAASLPDLVRMASALGVTSSYG